jgi:hypothetical protein
MSLRATSWAWTTQAAPTAKFVLVALADFADEVGHCWPALSRIVEMTGFSERAVRTALRSLEADGYLKTERGDGRGHSSRYRLAINAAPANPAGNTPFSTPKAAPAAPIQDAERGQEMPERGQEVPQRGQHVPKRGQEMPPNRKEPSGTVRNLKEGDISLPEWLPLDAWAEWCRHKGRKWGDGIGPTKALNALSRYRDEGHDPRAVIDHSLASGYAGLFPSKAAPKKPASKIAWAADHPMFNGGRHEPDRDSGPVAPFPAPARLRSV